MRIGILGCGNWGSVFGIIQYKNGHSIKIWEFNEERARYVKKTRDNAPFLCGYKIPKKIKIEWNIAKVLEDIDLLVFAVPSQALSGIIAILKKMEIRCNCYLSLTKGIDVKTLKRPSEIIGELNGKLWVLSGPSIANEIIKEEPTAVVLVGPENSGGKKLQHQLSTENFRIYQGDDIIGLELGAAIKNVIALGCGISDGLGFGSNAKGALITRGIVEMQRLGVRMGAKKKTFWGLSGFGDLITTSISEESRNHKVGKLIGQGKSLKEALGCIIMVAEGVPTAKAVKKLTERYGIETPICKVVYEILYEGKQTRQGLKDLMLRPLKNELN